MKAISLLLTIVLCMQVASAQLKTTPVCPTFEVDVLEGTVNEMRPYSTIGEIEQKFPCPNSVTPETNGSTCGGVFYKDKDIYFFTERDYIEIGGQFKGNLIPALLGTSRSSLFNLLGHPKIKDIDWDAYQMKYGILILYFDKAGKIIKLQVSNRNTETIKLCEKAELSK